MSRIEEQWYWDRRNNKAYYPVETGDNTVSFRTVWHEDEVADALRSDVLVPIDEIGFDPIDSFRTPADLASAGNE